MKTRNNEMMEAKIKVKNIDSHFSELRKRIIFSLIVYLIATILGFVFHRNILSLMVQPVTEINQLSQGLPVFTNITEFWSVVMKVSMLSGLLLSFPIISYQVLAFILPGLKSNEKNIVPSRFFEKLKVLEKYFEEQTEDKALALLSELVPEWRNMRSKFSSAN